MSAANAIAETTIAQRLAATPGLSSIVSANAGSGKTRVLTNRVARLLLAGEDPSTILCITFTKAAAAEMSHRLFKLLGEWALSSDEKLRNDLADLDGDKKRVRDEDELVKARRLFARALETPGGLKIQTIHSFCESLLKRFPLEAGVPPGFTVIEEAEAAELAARAVCETAAHADRSLKLAFDRLLPRMNGASLRALIETSVISRRLSVAAELGRAKFLENVAQSLNVTPSDDPVEIAAELLAFLPEERMEDAYAALNASGGKPQSDIAPHVLGYLNSNEPDAKRAALSRLFLVNDGSSPRKRFGTKATDKIDPSISPFLKTAQEQYLGIMERARAVDIYHDTHALCTIVEACTTQYSHLKAACAALDFDDLISRSRDLLSDAPQTQWVLYKLDAGIRHILLDEAQDTSPASWNVIERPLEEFFSGDGARETGRTFFAVGDMKQSIYSFQGADAALFGEKRENLGKRIKAVAAYQSVELLASFRTVDPALRFVDALFARKEVLDNVSLDDSLLHRCTREGEAGLVELWPLVERAAPDKADPWDAPLDSSPLESPQKKLAAEIAETISGWLQNGEMLISAGRPVSPGDVLILVQSRNKIFHEIIRALAATGVPVAGADKFKLLDDQGVLDLVSYARAALFEGDDLSLAETLKSPLFNIDEDSLFDLAADRRGRLWDALVRRCDERAEWRRAFEEISAARKVALSGGAVAFFSYALETGTPSGWKRLAMRLGGPSREPIEEFMRQALDFESRHPRSLRLFLSDLIRRDGEINRESSESGDVVRVMTAHKAKGLEANIVFLADAHRLPFIDNKSVLFTIDGPAGEDLPVVAIGDARAQSLMERAREKQKRLAYDEYRRLLYVAATRAKDRLYICGCESGKNKDPHKAEPARKSWHALAEDAFDLLGVAIVETGEKFGKPARRFENMQTKEIKKKPSSAPAIARTQDWSCLDRPAAVETIFRRLSPSSLADNFEHDSAYSPLRAREALLRGSLLHKLLELLPELEQSERADAAERFVSRRGEALGAEERQRICNEAIKVLNDPTFAPVFGPGSLAEVSIGGRPKGARADVFLSGQIDRLIILPDRVLIVDYKTNRPPPQRAEDAPPAYVAQLAAYRALLQEIHPGRRVEAALLWTFDARLMALPDSMLDAAFKLTLA